MQPMFSQNVGKKLPLLAA